MYAIQSGDKHHVNCKVNSHVMHFSAAIIYKSPGETTYANMKYVHWHSHCLINISSDSPTG